MFEAVTTTNEPARACWRLGVEGPRAARMQPDWSRGRPLRATDDAKHAWHDVARIDPNVISRDRSWC